MYHATTKEIEVSVEPFYLEDQSEPDKGHFVFAYHVRIENHGGQTVQLINRHWQITDGMGRTQEVRGPGVVGAQPVLRPGESFEYPSGAVLRTERGMMRGTYQMHLSDGSQFDAEIAPFALERPYSLN